MKTKVFAILGIALSMFATPAIAQSAKRIKSNSFLPNTPGKTAVVEMEGDSYKFFPATIVIRQGQTVEWKNESGMVHNVVDGTRAPKIAADMKLPKGAIAFDSGYIKPDESYSYTFDVPGVYRYVCTMHEDQGMVGTVIVK